MQFNTESLYRRLEDMEKQLLSEMTEDELKMVEAHKKDKHYQMQKSEKRRYQEFVQWVFRGKKKR